jgi:hypothetical protein
MDKIIRKKELTPEFYLNPEEASKRYDELVKEERAVWIEPLFGAKLWIITYENRE